jgi:uncharacterized protein
MRKKIVFFTAIAGFFLMANVSCSNTTSAKKNEDFHKKEMKWREARDKSMRSPTSWLTIAGLFWLDEGENTFGTDKTNKLVLPPGSAPSFCGTFILGEGRVKVMAAEGAGTKIEGKEVDEKILTSDDQGNPDVLELNDLRMWVIKRGERCGIRMRDPNARAYKEYKGLEFFPPSEKYRIKGNFVPYDKEKIIEITTFAGTKAEMISPGSVLFALDGKEYRLEAFKENEENTKLFIVFKDLTNGEETFAKGRFLTADVLDNGKVDLNFNRAVNPPCNYTPYATCPVPPHNANWLNVRIEAGEKAYTGTTAAKK